jgi:Mg2+ and Co2+ transporter CorA
MEAAKLDHELRDMTEKLNNLTQNLLTLTEHNVDESTTVKIITFVSAFYLPGSFVATLFGMNFFYFDQERGKIVIAEDFWIFLASWLPLTLITAAIYVVIVSLNRKQKLRGR